MTIFPNAIEVFNAALAEMGENTIHTNENGAFARLYRAASDIIIKDALSLHEWSFAQATALLTYQGPTGSAPPEAYIKPVDVILIHKLTNGASDPSFYSATSNQIRVRCKSDEYYLHYTFAADTSIWSADFKAALKVRFQSIIARGPHGDHANATQIYGASERMFLDGIGRDANAQGGTDVTPTGRFVKVQRGAGRHG